ncbi:Thioesterase/thiol ester dehydrase-isomerase [Thelephora terrestris]|uniref:Thioesterase/thiol ester dehydrase-isomerase n=1 Tax=Thelephora terrestris TaxID=56493 RepID=A0A9P6HFK9_9AGAM|nr:Thioesterase/thiol ester dehydrase-isomerase [Thelephora terrestris]
MTDGSSDMKQSRRTDLTSLLDLEVLDVDFFRSTHARLPRGVIGVYGGQVVAQAIVAATHTLDRAFHIHSLHCYFVSIGLPATPIYYHVDRIRDGRSYSARAVRAAQNGKMFFIMLCSYQKPEPWQPTYRSPMPNVPAPEECDTFQAYFRRRAEEETDAWTKHHYTGKAEFHDGIPIEVRRAAGGFQDGFYVLCMWVRAVYVPECDAAYQKAVLGYISDLLFLEAGGYAIGLRESNEEGADVTGYCTTVDHSIWYYSDDFDCTQWIMFESRVPQAGSGRAIVHRRAFTRDGTLIANLSQEGVVRAKVYGPGEPSKVESKL